MSLASLASLCLLAAAPEWVDPENVGYHLELGSETEWPTALRTVRSAKQPADEWLRSVLKRLHVLPPGEQAALLSRYAERWQAVDAPILRSLLLLAREGAPEVRAAAWKLILQTYAYDAESTAVLAEAFPEAGRHREKLFEQLVSRHALHWERSTGEPWGPAKAARAAREGARAPELAKLVRNLVLSNDQALMARFFDRGRWIADPSVDELLWRLTGSPWKPQALDALADREDPLAAREYFDLELESVVHRGAPWSDDLSSDHRPLVIFHAFERFRQRKGTPSASALEAFLVGTYASNFLDRLAQAGTRARWESHTSDPEPVIRSSVQKVLADARREAERNESKVDRNLKWLLICCGFLSAFMGVTVMLWGMRLLRLRWTLHGTPPLPIASAALGTGSLRGEVYPEENATLVHPVTGELCVHYPRPIYDMSPQRFWLVDDSGRILVDARGGILLSEDNILVPGERVQILGEVRRRDNARPDEPLELVRPTTLRSFAQKVAQVLVHTVLGAGARKGQARLLFSDPSSMLVIWDDLGTEPLAGTQQLFLLVGVFAFAGIWIAIFGAITLGLVDANAVAGVLPRP